MDILIDTNEDTPPRPIGEIARKLRTQQGRTLEEVAERAGMSHMHLWRIEHGKTSPTVEKAHGLAKALGVRPRVLLDDNDPEPDWNLEEGIIRHLANFSARAGYLSADAINTQKLAQELTQLLRKRGHSTASFPEKISAGYTS
jgi:transcriptional regulator with XRE-family HTH domain